MIQSQTHNNLVVQSNKLIEAHYKQEYTVQEQRMILWVISEINKEDFINKDPIGHQTLTISAMKYAEIIGVTADNIYRESQKIGNELMQKVIKIETDQGWKMFHWVETMEYKKGEGIIEVLISPSIIPYIIDLKEKFTAFKLGNILYLQSAHAIKIYQLLAQYKAIGARTITVDELRATLGIADIASYKMYKNLKPRILEISKREINNKTDLTISYEEIKKSRKVIALKFKITQKPTQEEQAQKAFIEHLLTAGKDDKIKFLFEKYGLEQAEVQVTLKNFIILNIANYAPESRKPIEFVRPL